MNKHDKDKKFINGGPSTFKRVAEAKERLPYGFIPVGDEPIVRNPINDLGKYDPKTYTGYINCTLYALNELCVGNRHQDLGLERTSIEPLKVNEKVLIPSNTLKGCIVNFIAAYLKLPISRMNNYRYSFRPNNASSGSRMCIGAGLVESITSGVITIKKFKENIFAFVPTHSKHSDFIGCSQKIRYTDLCYNSKEKTVRKAHKYILDDSIDYRIPSEKIRKGSFFFYEYHDGIDGEGFFGEKAEFKASHKRFGVRLANGEEPEFEPVPFKISADKYEEYKKSISNLCDTKEGHLNNHPILTKHKVSDEEIDNLSNRIFSNRDLRIGSLVFFEHETDSSDVITFGKHYRYRWAYTRDLHDFKEDYQPYDYDSLQKGNITEVEELFGYSYGDIKEMPDKPPIVFENRSKAGKIHFSYAEHVPGTGGVKKDKWLPRPGGPKPSSFEFYLRQEQSNENNVTTLTTFGDPARHDFYISPRLSGRKFYYSTVNTPYNDYESQEAVTKTIKLVDILYPMENKYPEFKFKVHYENLNYKELKLLRFALCLGDNTAPQQGEPLKKDGLLCHQVGYGKNYGMGAVKIVIDTIKYVEQIISCRIEGNSISAIPVCVEDMILSEHQSLFQLLDQFRQYPIDTKAKEKAIKIHKKKYNSDTDSDGVGVYSWHTNLKNNDLKSRRNG